VGGTHTGNSGDFQDYTDQTGVGPDAGRVPDANTGGNIYAIACTNCHGGVVSNSGTNEFGTIHGTSQVLDVGAGGTRRAYRFMNGNSLRFYRPGDANGTAPWDWTGELSCYTLGTGDEFGGCVKHSGGRAWTPPVQRGLSY
jgi:hypothetical protein